MTAPEFAQLLREAGLPGVTVEQDHPDAIMLVDVGPFDAVIYPPWSMRGWRVTITGGDRALDVDGPVEAARLIAERVRALSDTFAAALGLPSAAQARRQADALRTLGLDPGADDLVERAREVAEDRRDAALTLTAVVRAAGGEVRVTDEAMAREDGNLTRWRDERGLQVVYRSHRDAGSK